MSKRDFLIGSASALAIGTIAPRMALAQSSLLQEGKNFRLIQPVQRTEAPKGMIEVIEFFWYACPHCYALEPVVLEWLKKLGKDVHFRKVHVNFRGSGHQQIYYTLLAMKVEEQFTPMVFEAIHKDRKRMTKEDQIFAWAEGQKGLDADLFKRTFKSFGVRTQMRKASQATSAFGVDGVPALAVNGKFYTAPSMAGTNGGALAVVDALVEQVRKGG